MLALVVGRRAFRTPPGSKGPLLGYALKVENPELQVTWVGTPREILEEARVQRMGLRRLFDAPQTTIDAIEVYKESPMVRFTGGPHALTILGLLEALDGPDLGAISEKLAEDPAALSGDADGAELPLIKAAWLGQAESVRILLRSGARVDRFSHLEMTALHWASAMGWTDVVSLLLEAGADPCRLTWFLVSAGELADLNRQVGAAKSLEKALGRGWPPFSIERVLERSLAFQA